MAVQELVAGAAGVLLWATVHAPGWAATVPPPPATSASAALPFRLPSPLGCDLLMNHPWPGSPTSRRALIARLQDTRAACIENAPFLGLLGALLLEDGDLEQALSWLERSLLLDPDSLGVQADHALVLAAMGQPAALRELTQQWQHRSDLPPALRQRLFPPGNTYTNPNPFALPVVRLGREAPARWGTVADLSVMTGYEDNLGRSPRLTELTLTVPEGPLVLPVSSRPLKGAASIGAASFQVAYAPAAQTVLRSGLSLTARTASSRHQTDWHQMQWGASVSHSWNGLRAQLDASSIWFGGDLGEAFHLQRQAATLDWTLGSCSLRLAAEEEKRGQSVTASLNSKASANLASFQCPLDEAKAWSWSIALRSGRDEAAAPDRPGGTQKLGGLGLRLTGSLGAGTRVEASLRRSTVIDTSGYSVLLEDNLVRRLRLMQVTLDIAHPISGFASPRMELLLQVQSAAQSSNLPLFRYRADSVYSGLRWSW